MFRRFVRSRSAVLTALALGACASLSTFDDTYRVERVSEPQGSVEGFDADCARSIMNREATRTAEKVDYQRDLEAACLATGVLPIVGIFLTGGCVMGMEAKVAEHNAEYWRRTTQLIREQCRKPLSCSITPAQAKGVPQSELDALFNRPECAGECYLVTKSTGERRRVSCSWIDHYRAQGAALASGMEKDWTSFWLPMLIPCLADADTMRTYLETGRLPAAPASRPAGLPSSQATGLPAGAVPRLSAAPDVNLLRSPDYSPRGRFFYEVCSTGSNTFFNAAAARFGRAAITAECKRVCGRASWDPASAASRNGANCVPKRCDMAHMETRLSASIDAQAVSFRNECDRVCGSGWYRGERCELR